jgi:hypothetical protein
MSVRRHAQKPLLPAGILGVKALGCPDFSYSDISD